MAETQKKVLLSITNLQKYFPIKNGKLFSHEHLFVRANEDISLNIYEGETFGLVGESGCGKSTFGRVLLQLYAQTDGRTMYYGRTLDDLTPRYIPKLLHHLEHEIKRQQKLEAHRQTLEAQYNALPDDAARWAMHGKLTAARKEADDLFVDIAKIVGGFLHAENPKQIASMFLREYHAAAAAFQSRAAARKLQLELDAMLALARGDDAAAKARALRRTGKVTAQLHAAEQRLAVCEKTLADVRKQIDTERKRHIQEKAFAHEEALRDDGIDLAKLTPDEMRLLRKDLQLIFQDPYSSLNPRMTVAQLIGEGLLAHDFFHKNSPKMQDYILKVMDDCGLAPYMMHRYPHQFSGGQRQRIGIARSLALKPRFVVCDEAVSALDVSIQSQMLNLLQDLKEQENLTYLFISHDLSVIKYISDRIGVMYLGNIVELATSKELFEHPLHPYTEALLLAIPTTDPDASRDIPLLEGDIPSAINPPSGCKFHTRCRYATEKCRQVVPTFDEIRPNHFVACHRCHEEHA